VAILGAGSAGCGVAEQLVAAMVEEGVPEADARGRFYLIDRAGLLHDGMSPLLPFQRKLAQPKDRVIGWGGGDGRPIGFLEVVEHARPSILIGTSGQPGTFTEDAVRAMARHAERPIIFPLSNPTSRAEAHPAELDHWTDGRALIATGSPFAPIHRDGVEHIVAQCNNVYIFPAMGLAVTAAQATRVTDEMMRIAAATLGEASPALDDPDQPLLPSWSDAPEVAVRIAQAVAVQAVAEGVAPKRSSEEIAGRIAQVRWMPAYPAAIP
jgi:malate dehydrogenase (oxaloacetate-decarboxylating)